MSEFRIMPAQHMDCVTENCTRYGMFIPDHPKGQYIASWATYAEAEIAAFMLGVAPSEIDRVGVMFPERIEQ